MAQELTVAAAADLFPLQSEISRAFRARSGVHLRWTFGSSGMLARQIENGAPYDVYLSANEDFVGELAEAGLIDPASLRRYATGRIGLWSKSGRVRTLEALTSPAIRHIAIPNPKHAPYGIAAEQALRKAGLWEKVQGKLLLGENVRQAFAYARTGNADAVITAWTLLVDAGAVLIPAELHAPVRQAAGVVAGSRMKAAATQLLDFLSSAAGQSLLKKYGFSPPQ